MSKGINLIAAERERQITEEGYTAEHDDGRAYQLTYAARVYTAQATVNIAEDTSDAMPFGWARFEGWPWRERYWKPSGDPIRDLTKAGALIAAAIDSLAAEQGEAETR